MSDVQSETTKDYYGAVIYVDGSCRPSNPGFIGWGAHGYLYQETSIGKDTEVERHKTTTYGYFPLTQSLKEFVKPVEPIVYIDFLGSFEHLASNNVAEIQALYYSLLELSKLNLKKISVSADSEYLIKGIKEWSKGWVANGWLRRDGQPVSNQEWWKPLVTLVDEIKASGCEFSINWVKAHVGIFGNIQADMLAGIGMNRSRDGVYSHDFKIRPAKGYWKADTDRHPFINFKRAYFNSVESANIRGHYFQADGSTSNFVIGKRMPETGFAVIRLREEDIILEEIKKKQYEVCEGFNAICELKLDNIYAKRNYGYFADYGKYPLVKRGGKTNNLSLEMIDKTPVTIQMDPTGLSIRALDVFALLSDLLDSYVGHVTGNKESVFTPINVHDITDVFFESYTKKVRGQEELHRRLKPEYGTGHKLIEVDIKEPHEGEDIAINVKMLMGLDILPRNNLKRIETESPKVHLVTWKESVNSVRYATIIDCDSGVGIWSNFYADRVFLTKK